jgi:hypothetical protein
MHVAHAMLDAWLLRVPLCRCTHVLLPWVLPAARTAPQ